MKFIMYNIWYLIVRQFVTETTFLTIITSGGRSLTKNFPKYIKNRVLLLLRYTIERHPSSLYHFFYSVSTVYMIIFYPYFRSRRLLYFVFLWNIKFSVKVWIVANIIGKFCSSCLYGKSFLMLSQPSQMQKNT